MRSTERPALMSVAAAGHSPHHVRGQDLTALAEATQPRRLDHGVTEVVVVLPGDLPPC